MSTLKDRDNLETDLDPDWDEVMHICRWYLNSSSKLKRMTMDCGGTREVTQEVVATLCRTLPWRRNPDSKLSTLVTNQAWWLLCRMSTTRDVLRLRKRQYVEHQKLNGQAEYEAQVNAEQARLDARAELEGLTSIRCQARANSANRVRRDREASATSS